jgi:tetratricopeptide (TPR) repeat protein
MKKIAPTIITSLKDAYNLEASRLFQTGFNHHRNGQLDKAKIFYKQAILKNPKHFDALHLCGVIEIHNKNTKVGLELIERALKINPQSAEAHFNKGMALLEIKKFEDAISCFDKAIKFKIDYFPAFFNRGNALAQLEKFEEAVTSYKSAVLIAPSFAEGYCNLGNALTQLGKLEDAVCYYEKSIQLAPGLVDAYLNISSALIKLDRKKDALTCINHAIELDKNDYIAYLNRGKILIELDQFHEAISSFNRAIEIEPSYSDAYCNYGLALMELLKPKEALLQYEKAISIDPFYYEAINNKGEALSKIGHYEEGIKQYDLALQIKPDYPPAQWNKSNALLTLGNFDEGWRLYESRWKVKELNLNYSLFKQPLWLGNELLTDKTILLHSEQGLGDTIQFCRYSQMVSNLGARVILRVQKPLLSLFKQLQGVHHLIGDNEILPDFDFHCPLMSLPLALKTNLNSIPNVSGYLWSDPIKRQQWSKKIGQHQRKLIGLAWSGNPNQGNDGNRSIKLSHLLPYLPNEFSYISLQKEVRDYDKETLFKSTISHFGDDIHDFSDTAAICDLVDLVVSVDSSVAHLSGAMGKPTSVLLPYDPGWRWLLNRDDSPWYQSVKLFRQNSDFTWDPVFRRLADSLF